MPVSFYQPTEDLPPFLQGQRNGGNKVWNMGKAFKDKKLWRNYVGAYYALVSEVDHYVGEILEALEAAGMEEETIIIYTSDHGDFAGNHGMVEKASAGHNDYEDILNVPLIIKIPGQKGKGKRTAELVSLVDVLPTLVEVLELKTPNMKYGFQGLSLAGLLMKDKPLGRDYVVSESWFQASVITKDAKLGIMLDPNPIAPNFDFREYGDMYFDRSSDFLEVKNGISKDVFQNNIKQLRTYYMDFEKEYPDIKKQEMILQKQKAS